MYDERKQRARDAILIECSKRNITVARRGQAYLLTGAGVYVLAADLSALSMADLAPYQPQARA